MTKEKDDLGRTITLAGLPVRRIVSLAPAATENLFALGAGDLVVGVTTACDFPVEAQKRARIGPFYQPSVERIRALRPDVVVVDSGTVDRAAMDNLQTRLRLPVFAQRSVRFEDVARHLEQLGRLTGRLPQSARLVAAMNTKAASVARRIAGQKLATVFVEISATPLYAAGPGSFIDDLIRRARGVNVVKGRNPYPVVSKETLLAADPDHYIVAVGSKDRQNDQATLLAPLDRLRAARTGRIHRLPADLLFRPTPRLADGLVLLARALHP